MLYYLSSTRLPSKKAHVIQQLNMCQAFSAVGENCLFVSPRNGHEDSSWETISEHYGLSSEFELLTVPSPSKNYRFPNVPYAPSFDDQLVTAWLLYQYSTGAIGPGDVLYSRNLHPTRYLLRVLDRLGIGDELTVWFEQHQVDRETTAAFYERLDGVVCISERMKRRLVRDRPVDPDDVLAVHDGVDLTAYARLSTETARRQLGIDANERVVMYTGHLYPSKDVERLVRAAAGLDATCYVVGGYPEDVSRIRDEVPIPDNVTFTGFVPPSEVPVYQAAADVLVATVAADPELEYVSPLKLFEYMAAGKPIVVSRKPDYEEVLTHGENALFVEPESTPELETAVETLLSDPGLRDALGRRARVDVERYGWTARARRILGAIHGDASPESNRETPGVKPSPDD